jgi:hypothetical protein
VTQRLAQIGGSLSPQAQQQASAALADLQNLSNLRLEATQSQLPAPIIQKYSRIITDLLVLGQNTGQGVSDATLAETVRVLGLVSRMKEDASQQRAILTAALIKHELDSGARTALLTAKADQAANLASFSLAATDAQRQLFQDSFSKSFVALADQQEAQALSMGASLKNDTTTPDDFYGAMTNEINTQLGSVERNLVNSINARADMLHTNYFISWVGVAVFLIVLVLLFVAVLVFPAPGYLNWVTRLPEESPAFRDLFGDELSPNGGQEHVKFFRSSMTCLLRFLNVGQ